MDPVSRQTQLLQSWIEYPHAGRKLARDQLLQAAADRLIHLTRRLKRDFQRLDRWEQVEAVFQQAPLRLYRALENVKPNDVRHFFRRQVHLRTVKRHWRAARETLHERQGGRLVGQS